ncbi:MAG TPA: PEGA domain-containing protein [Labilithrix sp.]
MAWSRPRLLLCGAALAASIAIPSSAFAQDAKTHLASADKAAAQKNWATAAAEYDAANKAEASAPAAEGVANAEYQQKHDAEAYAAYKKFVDDWGAKVAPYKRTLAESRMKEIAARTGELAVTVSEPGATIAIDDKAVGTSPLSTPLRLPPGPHRVRVTKDGFLPFDQAPNAVAGQSQTLDVKLQAQANKGRLSVREKTNKPIHVVVDNVDQGDAPWSGDLDPGEHQVSGRGPGVAAPPQRVVVERGKTAEVELASTSATAPLRVVTSDGKGLVYVDDKVVGEGQFTGDLPAGVHRIKVTREGYDPFEEEVTLQPKEPLVRTITLKLVANVQTSAIEKEGRALDGWYGGFGLIGMLAPAGFGSSPEQTCDNAPAEVASCDKGTNLGAGLNGFFGYHWDPVGVELFLGAHYDTQSPKIGWNASNSLPGLGPDPARSEEFTLHRAGGFGAIRVRVTLQSEKIRFTAAGGVGLGYMEVFMKRVDTLTSDPTVQDAFAPSAQGYLTPVLSLDPSIGYRLSQTLTAQLGFAILVESARAFDNVPTTNADPSHALGRLGITTPRYQLATGTEVYLGPFLGLMFGP